MSDEAKKELSALRAEYKAIVGKNPSPRLNAEGLRAKIAELKANPPAPGGGANPPAEKLAKAVKLVKMQRNGKFADVHPDEVENFRGGGWVEAD